MDLGAGWDTTNTTLEVAYQLASVMDWAQTTNFSQHPHEPFHGKYGVEEQNPILGKHPDRASINTYFALTGALHALGSAYLREPYRTWFQGISLGVEGGQVLRNYNIGIEAKF